MQTPSETPNFSCFLGCCFSSCCWSRPLHLDPPSPPYKRSLKLSGGLSLSFFWGALSCLVLSTWRTWRTLTKFHLKIKLPSWLLCEFNKFAPGHVGVWVSWAIVCVPGTGEANARICKENSSSNNRTRNRKSLAKWKKFLRAPVIWRPQSRKQRQHVLQQWRRTQDNRGWVL